MNWIRELLNVYELKSDIVGIEQKGRFGERLVLLPQYHSTQVATVTVVLSGSGDFLRATRVAKDDAVTVIPVTEDSACARTSTHIAAHPLCDKLEYIAADYNIYAPKIDKNSSEKHRQYLEGIKDWSESEHSHEKVRAYMNTSKKDVSSAILSKAGSSCRTKAEKSRA